MIRPILSLWALWLPLAMPLVCLVPLLWLAGGPRPFVYTVIVVWLLTMSIAALPRARWRWRLLWHVRRFLTIHNGRIVLHYDSAVQTQSLPTDLLKQCQYDCERLSGQFGFRLRRRVAVFLFAKWQEIGPVLGNSSGAYALWQPNAILIGHNDWLNEVIPHELAHLFAGRWSQHAPPLLCEGLAVYFQQTDRGMSVDSSAKWALDDYQVTIPQLLNRTHFYAESERNRRYAIAGSFTSFLIRRHGWDQYRRLYRKCNGRKFRPKIEKCYGSTMEQLEKDWRCDLALRTMLE